jgi:hypothetical protein
MDTLQKFEDKLREENHPTVQKLNREIEDTIKMILSGGISPDGGEIIAPQLMVQLDDP